MSDQSEIYEMFGHRFRRTGRGEELRCDRCTLLRSNMFTAGLSPMCLGTLGPPVDPNAWEILFARLDREKKEKEAKEKADQDN